MSRLSFIVPCLLAVFLPRIPSAAVIHVPADYASIQAAIDAASNGDEIIVAEGTYERVRFNGKNLNVHSTDPTDINVVKNTIIKPSLNISTHRGSVVIFNGTEDETCRLAGFTITLGVGRVYSGEPGENGSGIRGHGCRALIEYNYIFSNVAENPTTTPDQFSPRWKGGGINDCDGVIVNNIITRNKARSIVYNSPPPGFTPALGGAMDSCNGKIINNTIVNNLRTGSFLPFIGGLSNCSGPIENNIIWHTSTEYTAIEFDNNTTPSFCIIRDWENGGTGNFDQDPLLMDITLELGTVPSFLSEQDYRLHPYSPAIDAGKSTDTLLIDIDGNVRGFDWELKSGGDGSNWDIGAYEFTTTSLNLWIPNRPLEIENGSSLDFHWLADNDAGDTIQLTLYQDDSIVTELGQFTTPMLGFIYTSNVQLPDDLAEEDGYTILGTSILNT